MADTITIVDVANFSASYSSLTTLGYQLVNEDGSLNGSAVTLSVIAIGGSGTSPYAVNLGSGNYQVAVTMPVGFTGSIVYNALDVSNNPIYSITPWNANTVSSGYGIRVVTQSYGGGNYIVQDSTGTSLEGATVAAFLASRYISNPQTASPLGQTTTNASGGWTLSLSPATYTVVASLSGYMNVANAAIATLTVT